MADFTEEDGNLPHANISEEANFEQVVPVRHYLDSKSLISDVVTELKTRPGQTEEVANFKRITGR